MGEENLSTQLDTLKADSEAFGEAKPMEIGPTDPPSVQDIPVSDMKQEPMVSASNTLDLPEVETSVSAPLSFEFEPKGTSLQSSAFADPQSLMSRLNHQYSVERLVAARSIPGSLRLPRKRKSPPVSALSCSASESLDAPNKRVEPVYHRPWLEQFWSAGMHAASLSPKAEHPPTPGKRVKQMESASQKSGKQAVNKKQTDLLLQGSTKAQNEGNESLRSKMKESLAAALALVLEREEDSLKEKKNAETEEASVPVAESNEPAPDCAEGLTSALSTKDESLGQKDNSGMILLQETCNDTKMNYVNQSDVQKTQFDDVFHCDDVPFSDSIFSSDELLHGNGLSWVLEPVSDFGENDDTSRENSFEDPDLLASKIELELFKLFGGVNKKYKEKGRSLLFNLKDKNNPELRESVMSGKISPERLCSMTAEELASKELSQWRQEKAEKMAEMVVLRDADIDVRSLVRKTHKGEFQVEIDPTDSETADVSSEITLRGKPRVRTKSMKPSIRAKSTLKENDLNDKNTKSEQAATLPSAEEEIDPMQGMSMDEEMKDEGFLPPIVSLDEFMESLNSEPPFGSPPHANDVKEEEPAPENSDPEAGSHSKSPSRSPNVPCESFPPKTEPEKTNVTSPKPDVGVKPDVEGSKHEKAPLVDVITENRIWDGILQLTASSVVSVTGIFKSGEKAKTSEWPTLVEVKGRVRLSAFGKFVKELPLSRSRVIMVMNVVCKDGISQSQCDSLSEVVKSYVADQRVGYAEPTSGVELYLCPAQGETLDLLGKIISKDHLEEVKSLDDIGLIGVAVWRRAAPSPSSRHKPPGSRRQHSSSLGSKSSALAPETKKCSTVNVKSQPVVPFASPVVNHGLVSRAVADDDEDDVPPGFGPVAAKDDDDLPEFNFNSSRPPPPPPAAPPQSRSTDQVRELIFKFGNSAGSGSNRAWDDDDDDDDIPEWQPQVQIQPPPPPPPVAGPPGRWRAYQNDPRQQQYSAHRNRGF